MNEESIFAEALELPDPIERANFLERACNSSPALRQNVEALLAAYERGEFLEAAAPWADATVAVLPSAPGEKPGMQIGPYKLLEQIGEGGMGVVYMALQENPVRRKVALKIIKPGMDTRQVIARFEAERQALALMDHPSIAKILDAGTTGEARRQESPVPIQESRANVRREQPSVKLTSDFQLPTPGLGRPYFVMELVKGIPITDYCDHERLNYRQRLELFVDVCRAVQHAHQKGIIHRDLKPSNVLVTLQDGHPLVKVIDFGVAKATGQQLTEKTLFTGFAQLIGTPLYMSPEQAGLSAVDVDTRSDVYSLGVLLYELLTGTTPFDREEFSKASFDELRRIIREDEPPRPSARISTIKTRALTTLAGRQPVDPQKLSRHLRGELDWIVMKALEKDRQRRYESVSALAQDVHRYLDGNAVQACPPSLRYRLSKLSRRYRGLLATAALFALIVVGGLTATTWQAIRATRAERRAESRSRLARRAVDDMYSQFAEKWLSEQGGLTLVQREFLEKALVFYKEFAGDTDGDSQVQIEALRALERCAAIQAKLGEHPTAERSYQKVIAESTNWIGRYPADVGFRLAQVSARTALAKMLRPLGRETDSNHQAELAYSDLPHIAGDRAAIGELDQRRSLAATLSSLAGELTQAGKLPEAETTVQRGLNLWQSLVHEKPDSWEFRLGLANGYSALGGQKMWWGGRNAEAEAAHREAEKRLSMLMQERPSDRSCRESLASCLLNLGVICSWEKRDAEALVCNRRSVAIRETLANDFPEDHDGQKKFVIALGNLASSLRSINGFDNVTEELECRQRHVQLAQDLADRFPNVVEYGKLYVRAAKVLGYVLRKSGEGEQAKRVWDALYQRIPRYVELASSNDLESTALIKEVVFVLQMHADRLLAAGDHAGAAETLGLVPPDYCRFQPELNREYVQQVKSISGQVQADLRLIETHEAQFEVLLRSSMQLSECARLAGNDVKLLSVEERAQHASAYRSRAEEYGVEADRALDAWSQAIENSIPFQKEPGSYVFRACERHLKDAEAQDDVTSTLENQHQRNWRLQLCRKLIEIGTARYPLAPKMHWVVGYLTAGPDELRDRQLALEIARQAADKYPNDGLAQQNLAWALFRNDEWDACLQLIAPGHSRANQVKADVTNQAVIAMSLQSSGRPQEAAEWLGTAHDRALKRYIEDSEVKVQQGTYTYPSPAMLQRLEREANELVGPIETN